MGAAERALPPKFLTRTAYARSRGLAYLAVREACEEGRITLFPGNLIDPDQADREWAANTDPTRGVNVVAGMEKRAAGVANGTPGAPPNGSVTFNAVRTQHEQMRLELTRVELEERRGNLVDVGEVRREQLAISRRLRDAVLQVSQQLAATLAACTAPEECKQMLDKALRAALEGVAGD